MPDSLQAGSTHHLRLVMGLKQAVMLLTGHVLKIPALFGQPKLSAADLAVAYTGKAVMSRSLDSAAPAAKHERWQEG